jgi:hypothetical protein
MPYEDFLQKFPEIDFTRLFQNDPNWRLSQLWTTMKTSVGNAGWVNLFDFTLSEASPVVVVLSRLNTRYFKGLEGRFDFTLDIRIHRPDGSWENPRLFSKGQPYRSISIDAGILPSGTYQVFLSASAVCNGSRNSPGMTIKSVTMGACGEMAIEKLAQIYKSYHDAHAKCIPPTTLEKTTSRVGRVGSRDSSVDEDELEGGALAMNEHAGTGSRPLTVFCPLGLKVYTTNGNL